MAFKSSEIERLLQSKFGFSPAKGHSSDHRWYELQLPGLPVILTKVSHSKAEIGSNLESKIARQLRVRRPFFEEMIVCTKGLDEYKHQVQTDPYPPFDVRL
jgi:hypothetical protein